MPFVTRCPMCRQKMRFQDGALGASQQCPRCHNYFTVVATEEAASPSATAMAVGALELPHPERSQTVAAVVSRGAVTDISGYVRQPTRKVNVCGLLSLLLGSLALPCASLPAVDFLTIPLAAIALIAGVLGLAVVRQRRCGLVLPVLGAAVSVPVLALALFWPAGFGVMYARGRVPRPPDAREFAAIPSRGDHQAEPARPADEDGLDIDAGGIRQGDVQVQVLRAFWERRAPARAKTAPPSVVLTIVVRVSNVGTARKIHYESWGTAGNTTAAHAPRLRGDGGQSYDLKDLGLSMTMSKRFPGDDLPAGTAVDDRLMFPEPAPSAGAFVLELPAAAVGGQGAFKFRLPRSKILAREPPHGRTP